MVKLYIEGLREKELEFLREIEEKKAKMELLREKIVRVVIKLMEKKELCMDNSDLQESLLQTLKLMFSSKRT